MTLLFLNDPPVWGFFLLTLLLCMSENLLRFCRAKKLFLFFRAITQGLSEALSHKGSESAGKKLFHNRLSCISASAAVNAENHNEQLPSSEFSSRSGWIFSVCACLSSMIMTICALAYELPLSETLLLLLILTISAFLTESIEPNFPARKHFKADKNFESGKDFESSRDFESGKKFKNCKDFESSRDFESGKKFKNCKDFKSSRDFESGKKFKNCKDFKSGRDFESGKKFKNCKDFESSRDFESIKKFKNCKDFKSSRDFESSKDIKAGKKFKTGRDFHTGRKGGLQ